MTRWAVFMLAALACASLAVNAALWTACRGVEAERDRLRAENAALAVVRTADELAYGVRDRAQQEIRNDAHEKYENLDRLQGSAAALDDAAFLDALRRVLSQNADRAGDAAGKPAAGLPGSKDSGGHDAEQ